MPLRNPFAGIEKKGILSSESRVYGAVQLPQVCTLRFGNNSSYFCVSGSPLSSEPYIRLFENIYDVGIGEPLEVAGKDVIRVGRATEDGFIMDRLGIEEVHAAFFIKDGRYSVVDLGSKGGTYIREVKKVKRNEKVTLYPLQSGYLDFTCRASIGMDDSRDSRGYRLTVCSDGTNVLLTDEISTGERDILPSNKPVYLNREGKISLDSSPSAILLFTEGKLLIRRTSLSGRNPIRVTVHG